MFQQYKDRIGADAIADNPLPGYANPDHLNSKQEAETDYDQCGYEKCLRRNKVSGVVHVLHLIEQDELQQGATGSKPQQSDWWNPRGAHNN